MALLEFDDEDLILQLFAGQEPIMVIGLAVEGPWISPVHTDMKGGERATPFSCPDLIFGLVANQRRPQKNSRSFCEMPNFWSLYLRRNPSEEKKKL